MELLQLCWPSFIIFLVSLAIWILLCPKELLIVLTFKKVYGISRRLHIVGGFLAWLVIITVIIGLIVIIGLLIT
jgi:hypothetical protein